jgi:hypothetical protein
MRATIGYSSKSLSKAAVSIEADRSGLAVRIAQVWLLLGSVALLCVPSLRQANEWLGWLPFWLVVAPLTNLLILRWRSLLDVSRDGFSRLQRRRSAPARRISRRMGRTRPYRQHAPEKIGLSLRAVRVR